MTNDDSGRRQEALRDIETFARGIETHRGYLDQAIKRARDLGVPVAQIAASAGMSVATIYRRVRS